MKVFTDVGSVVKLFSDTNNNRCIRLFVNGYNLVACLIFFKCCFVFFYFRAVIFQLCSFVKTAIFFLQKHKRLKNATCFYTFHFFSSSLDIATRAEPAES